MKKEFSLIDKAIETKLENNRKLREHLDSSNIQIYSANNISGTKKEELLLCRDKLNKLLEEEKFLKLKIASTLAVMHSRTLHCGCGEYNML